MKSKRQKEWTSICMMPGRIMGHVLGELFISEILHTGFVSNLCAVSIYDVCSPSEGRNRLIMLSPLSTFNLLCPKGIL